MNSWALVRFRSFWFFVAINLVLVALSGCGSTGSGGGWGDQKPAISGTSSGKSQSKVVVAGQSVTFDVNATGTSPFTYQWYMDGKAISGAAGSSYTIAATTPDENGEIFTVSVTNAAGTVMSPPATLTVNTPAVIVTQPQNETVPAGQTATFTAAATGTTPLQYQWYEGKTAISGATTASYTTPVTVIGNSGSIYNVAVTNVVNTATSNGATLTVAPLTPALSFASVAAKIYGNAPFAVSASSVSAGAITYTVVSGPASIAGNVVTLTGIGTVELRATQVAAGNYVAATATTTFEVAPETPTLTFNSVPPQIYGNAPVGVSASSASAGIITYFVVSGPATVSGNTVNPIGTGTVVLRAQQAAAGDYAASTATTSFQVNPATPTLTFTQPPASSYTYGAAAFTVAAGSASTGAIHYTVTGPATIVGTAVTLNGTGTVTLTASQDATTDYKAATVSTSFVVNPATPTLTFTTTPNGPYTFGASPVTVGASSASTGAIHYTVSGPASLSGTALTLTGIGAITLTATQDATANYTTATTTTTLEVNPAMPTLTFTSALSGSITFNPAAFTVAAQSNSAGTITYSVVNGPATIVGNQLQLTGTGTVQIRASQIAAGNYAAASITTTFSVTAANPGLQVSLVNPPTSFTTTPFSATTTSNSTGAITYSILSGPATISAVGAVTLTGPGQIVIQAQQAAAGGYTSATATVTVSTSQNVQMSSVSPASETIAPGTVTFSASSTGGTTNAITWSANGGTITAGGVWAAPSTPGTYTITATSADDHTKSASVSITISAPVIQTQPVSQSLCGNGTISLSVTTEYASSYQWYLNGSAISGATNSTYTLAGSSASNAGNYTVVASNGAGNTTSAAATVQVGSSITTQPASLTITQGQTAAFNVAATGKSPFTYQWYSVSGGTATAITNATSSMYITPVEQVGGQSASFYAAVTDSCGISLQSSTANLTVNTGNAPPTITLQPVGNTVTAGATATLSVTAVGSGTLSYQWYRIPKGGINGEINGAAPVAGTIVSGAMSASYTVPVSSTAATNDQDQYYVVVGNAYGQAVSQNATLVVNQGIQIQIVDQPANSYVNAGAPASFSVGATSTVPLSYQWYMVPPGESAAEQNITTWTGSLTSTTTTANAVAIEGANSATYTVPATSLSQNGAVYFVVVSNGGLTSSVTSNAGSLFVGPPTNIPVCSSSWIKQGTDVSYDAGSCSYTLTTAGTSEFGEIIWPNLISTGNVKLSFTIATSDTSSTPADGFAMVLGDPSLGAIVRSAGESGEGLGARGIPGFVLAFDDFYNAACTGSCFPAPYPADPSSSSNPDYLGVGRGEDVLWENPYFNVNSSIPLIAQSGVTKSHDYVVSIVQGYMGVTMDGTQVFSGHVSVPPVAYLYVTSSTGGSYEQTVISNISASISAPSN
jgi:hypothetical protein